MPQRLPRFQLHLSTCLVLMFVAGGLLWLNVMKGWQNFRGWPCGFFYYPVNDEMLSHWDYVNLGIDIFIAFVLLAATTLALELLFRRYFYRLTYFFSALLAGALISANLLPSLAKSPEFGDWWLNCNVQTQGWPLWFGHKYAYGQIVGWRVLIDLAVALALLTTTAFACEFILHRRKPPTAKNAE